MAESFAEEFALATREAQAAFNSGDFETAFRRLAPDVEWEVRPDMVGGGILYGRDAVIRFYEELRRDAGDWRVDAQEIIDAGDGTVVVHQHGVYVGRSTAIGGEMDFFQVWQLDEDGMVHRVREYSSRTEALQRAGLV